MVHRLQLLPDGAAEACWELSYSFLSWATTLGELEKETMYQYYNLPWNVLNNTFYAFVSD